MNAKDKEWRVKMIKVIFGNEVQPNGYIKSRCLLAKIYT
jgi:hypothetical protein